MQQQLQPRSARFSTDNRPLHASRLTTCLPTLQLTDAMLASLGTLVQLLLQ